MINELLEKAVKNSKLSLIAGVLCTIVGVIILFMPTETFKMIGIAMSVVLFIIAIAETINVIKNKKNSNGWILHCIIAVITLVAGVLLLIYPAATMVLMSVIIAFWLLYCGVSALKLSSSFKKNNISGSTLPLFYGILLVIIGILMVLMPIFAAMAIAYAVGVALIISGVFLLTIGLKLDKVKKDFEE